MNASTNKLKCVETSATVARVSGLTHWYGKPPNLVHVLRKLNLTVRVGELLLITGPSGSGKTTLLSLLGMLLKPEQGDVEVCGISLMEKRERELPVLRRKYVSFVFQAFNLLRALTARENVQVGLLLQGVAGDDAQAGARDLLARVGLSDRADYYPNQLSAGQQQRVAIARALGSPAPLLLADEPTGNLDSDNAFAVIEILRELAQAEQRAVVVVTHDPRLEQFADRVVCLEDGNIAYDTRGAAA